MNILEIQNISKTYGGNELLSNTSLNMPIGKIFGLIGSNGSGKTTLFNIITGLEKADEGSIVFNNQDISNFTARHRASQGIGRLFQQPRIFQNLSLEDNLLAAVTNHPGEQVINYFTSYGKIKGFENKKKKEAQSILEDLKLADKQYNKAGELSYGQQKLLSFGMQLINNPKLILLDEFFAGVANQMIEEMSIIIKKLTNNKISILMIEHNAETLQNLCDEVYRLENKQFSKIIDAKKYAE